MQFLGTRSTLSNEEKLKHTSWWAARLWRKHRRCEHEALRKKQDKEKEPWLYLKLKTACLHWGFIYLVSYLFILFHCTAYWGLALWHMHEACSDHEPHAPSCSIPASELRRRELSLALCCNREVKYETKHTNAIRRVCKIWGLDILTVSEAGMSWHAAG